MEVTADLLGEKGRSTESIPYADIVAFTCLKAFAFDPRHERKDAHDLVYCLEHGEGGLAVNDPMLEFLSALGIASK
ncbi:hypothetical protein ACCT24_31275 [Rhizobium ruizarguesonis]|jgi:hypothetical protein